MRSSRGTPSRSRRVHPAVILVLLGLTMAAACPENPVQPPSDTSVPGTAPAAPTVLNATAASATVINLAWTDNSNNEDGFRVERAPGGTSTFVEIGTVAAGVTAYQSTGLTAATSYSYRVRAYNATGNSAYSATATASTQAAPTVPPTAPSALGATAASSTQINLSWTDNSNNEDGFRIERAPGGTTTFAEIATVGAGVTTYQNTGLSAATGYVYRVRAYNGAGNSAYSNSATATTPAGPTAPAAPSGLVATAASTTQINLAWTDNSSNEDGFRIERAPGGTTTFAEIATVGAGVTTYQSTGLSPATSYAYRVRAYNGVGSSAYSATSTTSTLQNPPSAPTTLGATAASSSQINLSWTDNSNNEDGFRIERAPGGTTTFAEIGTVGAGVSTYQSTGLSAATSYAYRVRAYNGGGNSAYSNTATASTQAGTPGAPTGLSATASTTVSSVINLSWTDNANNETGFRIEQAIGAGGFVELGTVGANLNSAQITGLTGSTTYNYRIRSYNGAGNSSYSNTDGATTLPSQIFVLPSADNTLITSTTNANVQNTVYPSGVISVGCNFAIGQFFSDFVCASAALQFGTLQSQIAGRTITSAILRLYPYSIAADFNTEYAANAFASAWTTGSITFANQPQYFVSPQWNIAVPTAGVAQDFNVTTMVQQWASGTRVNNGILLRDVTYTLPGSTAYRATDFHSVDTYGNTAWRPQLIITMP